MKLQKTLYEELESINKRLKELSEMNYPNYRSGYNADGIWVDMEPVPEYLEETDLIGRARELYHAKELLAQGRRRNPLMISLLIWLMSEPLDEEAIKLQTRIAQSVYMNKPIKYVKAEKGTMIWKS